MFKKGKSYTYRGLIIGFNEADNMYHVNGDIMDLSPDHPASKKHVELKAISVINAMKEIDLIV